MFKTLAAPEPDKIIKLMQMFRDDPRAGKVDLGVGVYRDAEGRTPVMRAVKSAENRIWQEQDSKSYVALTGDTDFSSAMLGLLLGGAVEAERIAATGAPGGTGAIRQVLELARAAAPEAAVWVSRPSWPIHEAIVRALGMPFREYRYFDATAGSADVEAMRADLEHAAPGDIVLLHGCCHNPTGADLAPEDWAELAALLHRRGLVPLIDVAYQGFGEGLDADAAGLRHLAARLPEVLVTASCSKNFGLYRDRVGLALAICADSGARDRVQAAFAALNRQNFAFPPDHGARVVSTILGDAALRADWEDELATMRARIRDNRVSMAAALRVATNSDRFDFLARHRGMFSLTGLRPDQVSRLREEHGLYLIGDGRANVAGVGAGSVDAVARAIASVL